MLIATVVPSAVWIGPKPGLKICDAGLLTALASQAWIPLVLVNPACTASYWQRKSANATGWSLADARSLARLAVRCAILHIAQRACRHRGTSGTSLGLPTYIFASGTTKRTVSPRTWLVPMPVPIRGVGDHAVRSRGAGAGLRGCADERRLMVEVHAIGSLGPRRAAEAQGHDDLVAFWIVVALQRVDVAPAASHLAAVEDEPLADGMGIGRAGDHGAGRRHDPAEKDPTIDHVPPPGFRADCAGSPYS